MLSQLIKLIVMTILQDTHMAIRMVQVVTHMGQAGIHMRPRLV